jgi:hypothetical protein
VALAPARAAAGSRRSLLQAPATVAYTLAVSGSQSAAAASAFATAITGFTHLTRGLTAQLAMAGVLATDVALVSQPTVSVRLNLAVVHPDVNASPQDALDAALTSGSLAAALNAAGVANTGVASSSDEQDDEPALSQLEKELIGGIIGAVFGAIFIALVRMKRLACAGLSHAVGSLCAPRFRRASSYTCARQTPRLPLRRLRRSRRWTTRPPLSRRPRALLRWMRSRRRLCTVGPGLSYPRPGTR